jgi:hypothetical protein
MMKACLLLFITVAGGANIGHVSASAGGPMSKVFEMLADLQGKLLKEGEEAQKVYEEFTEWCQDRSKNVEEEIRTGKAEVEGLSATIEKESAKISASDTKVEELSGSIASDEADLKAATEMRASEAGDFVAEEKETIEVIGTLQRVVAVLSREKAKGSAALMQLKGVQDIAQAMDAMVRASVISSADASRLTALVQSSQESQDNDAALSAPDPVAYKSHSDGILATLEDLLDKASAQLESARKAEATSAHNYAMVKQSLTDSLKAGEKDIADTKTKLAASQEARSVAEGDLSTTQADLKEDVTTLAALHQDCTTGSEDFKAETKSRGEELKALSDAKKLLGEALPAAAQTYGAALDQVNFLQEESSDKTSRTEIVKFEAVRFIRDLARKQNSVELAQLASRMSSIIRYGTTAGTDPLSKVRSAISDMIAKLEKDAMAELSHKDFCDKETSETKMKKDEKAHQISKLATKIDSSSAKSAKLKEDMAAVQKELVELTSSQAEMDKIRLEEKALSTKNNAEMEAGIAGVQKALSVLRDYYVQEEGGGAAEGGAGSGIIGLLEVVESDFTKGLSEMEVGESTAVAEYQETSYTNKLAKASKDKDLEYKAKEAASLDKSATETGSDKDGTQAELEALLEYLAKLQKMCSAKAEPFADRKARRDAEIAGLKEALASLEGEAALVQQSSRRSFRGKNAQFS